MTWECGNRKGCIDRFVRGDEEAVEFEEESFEFIGCEYCRSGKNKCQAYCGYLNDRLDAQQAHELLREFYMQDPDYEHQVPELDQVFNNDDDWLARGAGCWDALQTPFAAYIAGLRSRGLYGLDEIHYLMDCVAQTVRGDRLLEGFVVDPQSIQEAPGHLKKGGKHRERLQNQQEEQCEVKQTPSSDRTYEHVLFEILPAAWHRMGLFGESSNCHDKDMPVLFLGRPPRPNERAILLGFDWGIQLLPANKSPRTVKETTIRRARRRKRKKRR